MPHDTAGSGAAQNPAAWAQALTRFQKPTIRQSAWQILNTVIPYLLLWIIMIKALQEGLPYWSVLLLTIPAGLFMVRLFILFHDCAHQSFFASKKANRIFGYIFGVLTFAAYEKWRTAHWTHHGTVSNLDRRGTGDFWTMTKQEYLNAPSWLRFLYRFARNPVVVFILGPIFIFMVAQRFPINAKTKREWMSVLLSNLGVLAIVLAAGWTIGFKTYFMIQIPIILMGGMLGLWLFYIQHNFEGVYWARQDRWDRIQAALEGSSFYRLPKILQWFTGSIGFHHIHHINPLIPNYNLKRCYEAVPELQSTRPLSIGRSLKSLRLHLWDEENQELIPFRRVHA